MSRPLGGNHPQGAISTYEMGYTPKEFAAVLPAAMRDWTVSGQPNDWHVSTAGGLPVAMITIEVLADRTMGALRLPVLMVTIQHAGVAGELRAEFMRRFERGFHRGGG